MKKLPVAEHLTHNEYMLLLRVYGNHNSSMSLKERVNYSLSHIVRVSRNIQEKCLEVHYENGNWWKYHMDGTWS